MSVLSNVCLSTAWLSMISHCILYKTTICIVNTCKFKITKKLGQLLLYALSSIFLSPLFEYMDIVIMEVHSFFLRLASYFCEGQSNVRISNSAFQHTQPFVQFFPHQSLLSNDFKFKNLQSILNQRLSTFLKENQRNKEKDDTQPQPLYFLRRI